MGFTKRAGLLVGVTLTAATLLPYAFSSSGEPDISLSERGDHTWGTSLDASFSLTAMTPENAHRFLSQHAQSALTEDSFLYSGCELEGRPGLHYMFDIGITDESSSSTWDYDDILAIINFIDCPNPVLIHNHPGRQEEDLHNYQIGSSDSKALLESFLLNLEGLIEFRELLELSVVSSPGDSNVAGEEILEANRRISLTTSYLKEAAFLHEIHRFATEVYQRRDSLPYLFSALPSIPDLEKYLFWIKDENIPEGTNIGARVYGLEAGYTEIVFHDRLVADITDEEIFHQYDLFRLDFLRSVPSQQVSLDEALEYFDTQAKELMERTEGVVDISFHPYRDQ